jgi:DNA-3-methyladenine glycosylase
VTPEPGSSTEGVLPEAPRHLARGAGRPLDPEALCTGAEEAARLLLGCTLVSTVGGETTGGRIVETEAYLGLPDPASHAAERIGRTRRNEPMFGEPGTAYVYRIYGLHWCFNVVVARRGDPQAVLIRAIEPELGAEAMRGRRRRSRDLTSGPARLCEALGIEGSLNGHLLSEPPLLLRAGPAPAAHDVGVSGRIGVRHAADWPLRFFLRGSAYVSPGKGAPPAERSVLP